jgi:biopolymer transport protein ExbB
MSEFFQSLNNSGGVFVWPLLVLAVTGIILFIERFLYLHKGHIHKNKFLAGVKTLVEKGRFVEALTLCEESPGPLTSVIRAALLHSDEDPGKISTAIKTVALSEVPLLERRLGGITLVANLGPFLGLLGTGMAALSILHQLNVMGPYLNSSAFAGDLSKALISTIIGLFVAACAIVGHHILNGRVNAIILDMEIVGQEMLQFLIGRQKGLTNEVNTKEPLDKNDSK